MPIFRGNPPANLAGVSFACKLISFIILKVRDFYVLPIPEVRVGNAGFLEKKW